MLASLKAGGTGLNLTAADHVFLLDPWWNPAVEDQAADRAHRIGQDKPVMVYRLVARLLVRPARALIRWRGVAADDREVGAWVRPIGVLAAEGIVGERAGSALGVVDHGNLEQRALGQHVLSE